MVRRLLPLLLGLSLALPAAMAATTLANQISNAQGPAVGFGQFDGPANGVGDFDGDGKMELVAHNDNQRAYVLASTTPRILAQIMPPYPAGWGARPISDIRVVDVNANGKLDIVLVTSAGQICVYEFTGGSSSTSMSFANLWCRRMDLYAGGSTGADAGPAVDDVDGDGKMEIFSQTETVGLFAYNHDGTLRWSKNTFGGNAGALVTDLEGDGRKEVIFFGDAGEVKAFDASNGNAKWSFFASAYVTPASIPVSGNAGDVDGDGKKEVVFIARDAHDATNFNNDHFMIFVLQPNGALKWRQQPSWGKPMSYTHPVITDIDGDGKGDILALDWNTIGHKPGNWESLGPSNVFAMRGFDGMLLWRTVIANSWSNDDLPVADVDGDGKQEVLAIGYADSGADGVWYLDLRTGAKEQHVSVGAWTAIRGATAANLGGDGKVWWAISVHHGSKGGSIEFFRTDSNCNVVFGGWQNPNPCGGGSGGGTPPPPPPPSGTFDATFEPRGGNEWWIQVHVTANQVFATVDARINGGPWQALTFRSWGDWANSYHAPAGSVVEFRATTFSGAQDVSGGFSWPSGTPVSGGGGSTPPPSGSWDANFYNVRGNEWWVEAEVTGTGAPFCCVDARVNGGTWIALDFTSWGSWAKSIHAPPGSTVEFRARATDGQQEISAPYRWPPA